MNQIFDAVEREMTRQALRQDGPLIDVVIYPICASGRECRPIFGKAMVDSGADRTAIEWSEVDAVGAQPDGVYHAQGVTSEAISLPIYEVRLEIEGLGSFQVKRAAATPHLKSQGIIALIGRDVLEKVKFVHDGPAGTFSLMASRGDRVVEVSSSRLPLIAVGGAVAVGAFAAWLFAPVCACDPR